MENERFIRREDDNDDEKQSTKGATTLMDKIKGTLLPLSKEFYLIVLSAAAWQTIVNLVWIYYIDEKFPGIEPSEFIMSLTVFTISVIVALQLNESISVYMQSRSNWDTLLTSITVVASAIAASVDDAKLKQGQLQNTSSYTEAVRDLRNARDLLASFPSIIKSYFRGTFVIATNHKSINLIRDNESLRTSIDALCDAHPVMQSEKVTTQLRNKALVDVVFCLMFKYFHDLSESGAIGTSVPDPLMSNVAINFGNLETAQTLRVLPVIKVHIWSAVILFFMFASFFMWPYYHWHSVWINAIFVYLFVGVLVAAQKSESPFSDPDINPFLRSIDLRQDTYNAKNAIILAFSAISISPSISGPGSGGSTRSRYNMLGNGTSSLVRRT